MTHNGKNSIELLNDCPPVPKFTVTDDFAFNDQYDKCIQMVDMLHDYVIVNKNKFVTDKSIKLVNEQITKFYKLSELVVKTAQVTLKISCIEQFKKIVKIINSPEGSAKLKVFYDSLELKYALLPEKINKIAIK